MALFDAIIDESREKFNIGDRADDLVSTMLSMMVEEQNGGLWGFLEIFENTGFGKNVKSWIGTDENLSITYQETESVYGEETLIEMAKTVGLDYEQTTSATAFLTPKIVDKLTPKGEVPNSDELKEIVSDFNLIEIQTVREVSQSPNTETNEATALKIIFPILLLVIFIAISYSICS